MRGSIVQWLAYLLSDPAATGLIPNIPEIFSVEKIVDVAEVNQWCCLEESEQWLENVDRAHLVLASGKLVLQKDWNQLARLRPIFLCNCTNA